MPFVRISLYSRTGDIARRVGDCVHRAMMETIKIPAGDRFQVVTQHDPGEIVYDPSFLGIERTDGIVMIQITLAAGRSREAKTALYGGIVKLLSDELDVRPEDVFITLLEAPPENFSFGNGEAQFADRLPPHLRQAGETS
ncbi:tautomerase family protein [Streptomyces sp. NPDC048483]|uniref:tautomerase family protein n=1 Tax=Streptomyces sp. NPDC048483 TaxID=3154927 RepID=UPI003449AB43